MRSSAESYPKAAEIASLGLRNGQTRPLGSLDQDHGQSEGIAVVAHRASGGSSTSSHR